MLGYSNFTTPQFTVKPPNAYPYPGMDAERKTCVELKPGERLLSQAEITRLSNPPTEVVVDGKVIFTGDAKTACEVLKQHAESAKESCEIRVAQL